MKPERPVRTILFTALLSSILSLQALAQEPCQEFNFSSTDFAGSKDLVLPSQLRFELKASFSLSKRDIEIGKSEGLNIVCRLRAGNGKKGIKGVGSFLEMKLSKPKEDGGVSVEYEDFVTDKNGEVERRIPLDGTFIFDNLKEPPYLISFTVFPHGKKKVRFLELECSMFKGDSSSCFE